MAKNKSSRPERSRSEQRTIRIQQVLFAAMAIFIILSMIISLVAF